MPSWRHHFGVDGDQHMGVAHAAHYERVTTLWHRRIGNGSIECQLLRAKRPAKRLVQLLAEWDDAGTPTTAIVMIKDELEEAREAARLERTILAASIRPTAPNVVA